VTAGTNPTTISGYGITDLLAQLLAGYVVGTNTALAATDSILGAFQKLQGQVNSRLSANQTITLSGDASGSGTTAITVTLANSGATEGTYGSSSAIPVVTVDAKGRVTSISTSAVSIVSALSGLSDVTIATPANGQLLQYNSTSSKWVNWTPNYITGNQSITISGDATGSGTTAIALTLANSGVTSGSYGSASAIPVITVDSKGRVTAVSTSAVSIVSTLSGLSDVTIATPANGQLLQYNSTTSKWVNWTPNYLTTNQSITLSGDATGSGTTSIAVTLANSGVTAGTYNNVTVNAKGLITSGSNTSYLTGNQTITVSGDATGSGATSIALTLANSGVTAGTYTKVTVDAKGRVTTGASLASADLPTYTGTLTSAQVTNALTYTPYNSSNPSGYITSSGSITGNAATATKLTTPDLRSTSITPNYFGQGLNTAFMGNSQDGLSDGGTYHGIIQLQQWSDSSGGGSHQLGFTDNNNIWHRGSSGALTSWSTWYKLIDSGNIGSQSVSYATTAGSANSVAWTNVSGRPTAVSSFTNDSGYVTSAGSVNYATSAGSVAWTNVSGRPTAVSSFTNDSGYLTSSTGVTTTYNSSLNSDSRNSRGVTRLYRRDSDSDYSVQTYWTGSYWRLYGYNGDAGHADTYVGYADNCGTASSANAVAWTNVSGRPTAVSSFTNDSGYITSAGRAYPRRSDGGDLNFYWSGQSGQPSWLWGGNDGVNMYVYNPSNFSVNYANTAGSAPANGGTSSYVTINYNNDSNSTYQMLWGSGNGVYGTGGIYCNPYTDTIYATQFIENSSIRFKYNVEGLQNSLSKVLNMRGVSYKRIGTDVEEIGVIAEEVEEIIPQVVKYENGKIEGVNYSRLTAVLIESIKEQQNQIDELRKLLNSK